MLIDPISIAVFLYQAIAFFLLGSWKEAIRHEAGELSFSYVFTSVLAAIFWPFVIVWYLVTRKK